MTSTGSRTALVTGATRGLGAAIAQALSRDGHRVVGTHTGTATPPEDLCAAWVVADFSTMAGIERAAEAVAEIAPDILVNNAGINRISPFVEIAADDFLRIQQVNVFAPFRLCQAAVPAMRQRRWGRIVNMASIWGTISRAQRASYSASKFAIDGLTAALAAECAADGVLANCVAPGFIDTELTRRVLAPAEREALVAQVPARRLGQPAEVAHLVRWLVSEENSYVSGQLIAIDGGFTRV